MDANPDPNRLSRARTRSAFLRIPPPAAAASLAAILVLAGIAVVGNNADAQVPNLRSGLCRDPGMGNELCIANIAVCDGTTVCGIQASPQHTFPATTTASPNRPGVGGLPSDPPGGGDPGPPVPTPCDNGAVNVHGTTVFICGRPIPINPQCGSIDLNSVPPRICGRPVPTDPCTLGNGACDLLERCLQAIQFGRVNPAASSAGPAVCGVGLPSCADVPAACDIASDCLSGLGAFSARSYGGLKVCGVDPFDCTVTFFCAVDCLKEIGTSATVGDQPDSVDICGVHFDLPCQSGIRYNPLSVCGVTLDPCQGHLCENPCVQAIVEAVAVTRFNAAIAANLDPTFNLQEADVPEDVCGIPLEDQCSLSEPGNIPGNIGDSLVDMGPFSTRHFLGQFEGIFHVAELADVDCIVSPVCTPSGANGRYMNLDCPCPATPFARIPGYDTDGDRSRDQYDVDDDCDRLVDSLEGSLAKGADFDSLVFDLIYLMNPYESSPAYPGNPVEFRVGVKSMVVHAQLDPWNVPGWADPYISNMYLCYTNAACGQDAPFLAIPEFNPADHPHNLVNSQPEDCSNQNIWVECVQSVYLPHARWDDAITYAWRASPTSHPKLDLGMEVWDHDCDDDTSCPTDDYAGLAELMEGVGIDFFQVANLVAGGLSPSSLTPVEMPLDSNGDNLKDVGLTLQFALAASKCATHWAEKNAIGGRSGLEIAHVQTLSGQPPAALTC